MIYKVRQEPGLPLDLILWRVYGRLGQTLVEQTLVANPGIAELGPEIPIETSLTLPDAPSAAYSPPATVSLFD